MERMLGTCEPNFLMNPHAFEFFDTKESVIDIFHYNDRFMPVETYFSDDGGCELKKSENILEKKWPNAGVLVVSKIV